MSKVAACFLVALGIGFLIVIDIIAIAPAWSIYMEVLGVFLALFAAVLYYMHHVDMKMKRKDKKIADHPINN